MNPIKTTFTTNGLVLVGSLLTSVLFTYQGFGLNTWLRWLESISNPGPFLGWGVLGMLFFGAILWPSHTN
jgi:hypothetical protein